MEVGAVKARQLIDGAFYGPEELKVIEQAFARLHAAAAPVAGSTSPSFSKVLGILHICS
jgi:hypothetical protein